MSEHKAALYLTIDNQAYRVANLVPMDEQTTHAWRLTRKDGTSYDVSQDKHGPHCTCPDFTYRRQNAPEPCKHCKALEAVGLLKETKRGQSVKHEESIPF